jgi:hypothetical protein
LPRHASAGGLPIGVVLGAGFGQESLLLRLSVQLEAAAPWRDRHPAVGLWNLGQRAPGPYPPAAMSRRDETPKIAGTHRVSMADSGVMATRPGP